MRFILTILLFVFYFSAAACSQGEGVLHSAEPNLIVSFFNEGGATEPYQEEEFAVTVNGALQNERIRVGDTLKLTVLPGEVAIKAYNDDGRVGAAFVQVEPGEIEQGRLELSRIIFQERIDAMT